MARFISVCAPGVRPDKYSMPCAVCRGCHRYEHVKSALNADKSAVGDVSAGIPAGLTTMLS
jgi:hypothetical protein